MPQVSNYFLFSTFFVSTLKALRGTFFFLGPIYEDVALKTRDDKYETLQKARGAEREGEYDTLHPDAPGRERMEGAVGGGGEYEALKKEGMKEELYHTLGMEGAGGGEGGGYEALKKEGMKEGVYHTLGTKGTGGGS